jgi:hypothetical protein
VSSPYTDLRQPTGLALDTLIAIKRAIAINHPLSFFIGFAANVSTVLLTPTIGALAMTLNTGSLFARILMVLILIAFYYVFEYMTTCVYDTISKACVNCFGALVVHCFKYLHILSTFSDYV